MTPEKLLTFPEVRERVHLCRNTLTRLEREGLFPAHRTIPGTRISGWLASEVDAWLRQLPQAANVTGPNAQPSREAA